jgi:integrase
MTVNRKSGNNPGNTCKFGQQTDASVRTREGTATQGTKKERRPGVWELRVPTGKRREPTETAKVKAAAQGRKAYGTPIMVKATFTGTGREADAELRRMCQEVDNGRMSAGTETFGSLLDRWLAHCDQIGHANATMVEHRRMVDKIIRPALGIIKLRQLGAEDLDRLYGKLKDRGNKPSSVRRVHAVIRAALTQAVRWRLVGYNVALDATPPPLRPADIESPDPEDVEKLVNAAYESVDPASGVLLYVAAVTGARRGELCGLKWSDLNSTTGTLTIARSADDKGIKSGQPALVKETKTYKVRTIPLDSGTLDELRRHREWLAEDPRAMVSEDGYIFSWGNAGRRPMRPDHASYVCESAAKAAGVDIHFGQLRHYMASQAIGAGFDPVAVAHRLGHSNPTTTMKIYAKAFPTQSQQIATSVSGTVKLPERRSALSSGTGG